MKKQPKNKSRLQELDEKQRDLERKMFQAYSSGMSHQVIEQLRTAMDFNQLELRDEIELDRYRMTDGISMSTDPDDKREDLDED